jgi:phosphate transport system substrate-binding protein
MARICLSRRSASLFLLGCSLLTPPAHANSPAAELVVGGTGAALGAMKALGDAYAAGTPQARVRTVPSLGSGGGIRALAAGAIQIAVTSRPLTAEERAKGMIERELIRTPFVFAVHQKAPIGAVTLSELAQIYAGTVGSWKDGTKVRPVLRPVNDVDTEVLSAMSPQMRLALKAAHDLPGKNIAVTDTDTADELERVPGAIGTSTLLLIQSEKRPLKALDVDGIAPTTTNLSSGRYLHQKSIYVVVSARSGPAAQAFVAYITSPAAAQMIARMGGLQVPSAP